MDNLKEGEVVFVINFVKNYNHQETEEPKSAHWDHMQSTMHPVVVKFKCQCGKTMTDKIIHFTSDLKHDAYAVKEFKRKTCLLYTSPSPRDATLSRMPSSA